jgi:hypothetical protein
MASASATIAAGSIQLAHELIAFLDQAGRAAQGGHHRAVRQEHATAAAAKEIARHARKGAT